MKLTIELVPSSCHGISLRNLLPTDQWRAIRKRVITRYGGKCAVCRAPGTPLHCHEQWVYDDATHLRRLYALKPLCSSCHWIKHIVLAKGKAGYGYLSFRQLVNHFCRVNEVDPPTFFEYRDRSLARCARRSQSRWRHDFGQYSKTVRPYIRNWNAA